MVKEGCVTGEANLHLGFGCLLHGGSMRGADFIRRFAVPLSLLYFLFIAVQVPKPGLGFA
jgi:hypothetical protein